MDDNELEEERRLAYVGITIGDVVSGLISQRLQSRKKSLLLFLSLADIKPETFICIS